MDEVIFALDEVIKLVKQGLLKPYVGAKFQANDIAKAHELLESRNSIGKVVVYWESN